MVKPLSMAVAVVIHHHKVVVGEMNSQMQLILPLKVAKNTRFDFPKLSCSNSLNLVVVELSHHHKSRDDSDVCAPNVGGFSLSKVARGTA